MSSSTAIDFEKAFFSSVRDGIRNTLGGPVMETLLTLLKQPFTIYSEKPEEFHHDLVKIFASAAATLEKMISKELFQRLDLHYPVSDLEFEACINLARRDMMLTQRGLVKR